MREVMITLPDVFTVKVRKTDRHFGTADLSIRGVEWLLSYGVKQKMADCVADKDFDDANACAERLDETWANVCAGVFRAARAESDPLGAMMQTIAKERVHAAIRAAKRKVKEYTATDEGKAKLVKAYATMIEKNRADIEAEAQRRLDEMPEVTEDDLGDLGL